MIVFLLWEGNRLIESYLRNKVLKLNALIIQFALSILIVLLSSTVVLFALYQILGEPVHFDWQNFKLSSAFAFRVNLFLNTVNAIVFYIRKSRNAEVENEVQQKLLLEAQHQNLKNQINPHFLFNSLNVLASLVKKDADLSEKFIEQLSKVYRYLLNHQEKELTTLGEELDFIDAYVYLLKTRFGEGFKVDLTINQDKRELLLAPGVLQLLFENAVKHNVVSKQRPLRISLKVIGDELVVENNLQLKDVTVDSTRIGLKNIRNRYQHLTSREVGIQQSDLNFLVTIPLISSEDEGTNR
jgi:two-component system LytT family sensor kinase